MTLPRVYPILDTAALTRAGLASVNLVTAAEALLEGGARILQFRHKDFWSRRIFHDARQIAGLCSSAGALFVVNDRADYAQLLGAALHIGQEDLTPREARIVVGNDAIVGFSTHNEEQMQAALSQPIDYVAFGPVFPTASKLRPDPTVGTQSLSNIRSLARALSNAPGNAPLVAIGGITRENASTCWKAGADSVAVIADLLPSPATRQSIRERMIEWEQLTKQ
jgi:thiamine-phosphate pyrophosphorylase